MVDKVDDSQIFKNDEGKKRMWIDNWFIGKNTIDLSILVQRENILPKILHYIFVHNILGKCPNFFKAITSYTEDMYFKQVVLDCCICCSGNWDRHITLQEKHDHRGTTIFDIISPVLCFLSYQEGRSLIGNYFLLRNIMGSLYYIYLREKYTYILCLEIFFFEPR